MIRRSIVAMALVLAAGTTPAGAEGFQHFSVTQARQLEVGVPAVRAYLDLEDSAGRPLDALPESSISATLGEWTAELTEVAPFDAEARGVAYVFLVDVSKSLNAALFQQMAGGIERWIQNLGPLDRAAIIAFGEESELVTDFTGDGETLLRGLRSLAPTDELTLLHVALSDALDMCRRLDSDLPGRRAVVIFSDGKDEGSAITAEDVLFKVRSDPSPIYAIGYSRVRDLAERRAFLDLLQRFASNSGGSFFEAEQTRFSEAYDSIRQTIEGVWVADFRCKSCRPDGTLHRLQVQVRLDGQVLSDGGTVRLLPVARHEATATVPSAVAERQDARTESAGAESSVEPGLESGDPGSGPGLLAWLALLVVGGVAFAAWRLSRRKRRARLKRAGISAGFGPPESLFEGPGTSRSGSPTLDSSFDPKSEPQILDPPVPPPMPGELARLPSSEPVAPRPKPSRRAVTRRSEEAARRVRFVVVRGSQRGKQYGVTVKERAVIGKRSDCDCMLTNERGIDAEQFELLQEDGAMYIRNLSETYPTLLSGRPITGKLRIASDSLVGTGDTVLRIVFY